MDYNGNRDRCGYQCVGSSSGQELYIVVLDVLIVLGMSIFFRVFVSHGMAKEDGKKRRVGGYSLYWSLIC
jgi:hypothetical protein